MLKKSQRLAVYMEGALHDPSGKMGEGVLRYSQNPITCVIDSTHAGQVVQAHLSPSKSVPVVRTVQEAVELGAEVLVLGLAVSGGAIPDEWYAPIDSAIAAGLSVVNGLHDHLAPRYPNLGVGQFVWDVRQEPPGLTVGMGRAAKLANRRVLFVGTDMAVGKMTAGLEIYAQAIAQGISTGFVATGQIGIVVTGAGIALDAIRVDFAAGAVEAEVLQFATKDLVLIEGQGALIHPASTANLPLLRGSMPTHLVMCCRAGQDHLYRVPSIVIPPLRDLIPLYEKLGSAAGVFAPPRCVAVAVNTRGLEDAEASEAKARIEQETGLPAVDPVRDGAGRLVAAIMA